MRGTLLLEISSSTVRAPCLQIMPTLGPKVYKYDLPSAIWSLRLLLQGFKIIGFKVHGLLECRTGMLQQWGLRNTMHMSYNLNS